MHDNTRGVMTEVRILSIRSLPQALNYFKERLDLAKELDDFEVLCRPWWSVHVNG